MQVADGGGGVAGAGDATAGDALSFRQGMDSLGQQMTNFRDAANAGQFSVNAEGGADLLAALREMSAWTGRQLREVNSLDRTGEYGGSHGAQVVEPFMNSVATDNEGFIVALSKFSDVLEDARSAIYKAMENYHQTDAENASGVRHVR